MASNGGLKGWVFGASRAESRTEGKAHGPLSCDTREQHATDTLSHSADSKMARTVADEKDPGSCPRRHAERLLAWCQQDGDRTGLVAASELMKFYGDLMRCLGWKPLGWGKVARQFKSIVGCKIHRDIVQNGVRRRVLFYDVPCEGRVVSPVARARREGAPMALRLAQLEATNAALADRIAALADRHAEMSSLIRQAIGGSGRDNGNGMGFAA